MIRHLFTVVLHAMGVEPRSPSTAYNFWSGFGSDISEFAIISALWHHTNCHDTGCLRLGRHVQVDGQGHQIRRCRRHLKKHLEAA